MYAAECVSNAITELFDMRDSNDRQRTQIHD